MHFHSVQDVAAQLGVDPATVRRWITLGELQAHQFGRQLRISDEALQQFISDSRVVAQ